MTLFCYIFTLFAFGLGAQEFRFCRFCRQPNLTDTKSCTISMSIVTFSIQNKKIDDNKQNKQTTTP